MTISPAKAHFQRQSAAQRGTEPAVSDQSNATAYELMLLKLAEDKRRLKDIQSIERKAEVKATLIPDYLPWIDGCIESDSGRQDDVLMTVFVWAIDTAGFDLALRIGAYAIKHGLTMPDQYKRDVPCVLAEEIADTVLKLDEEAISARLDNVEHAIQLTADSDMPDEVRAKLYKAWGYALRATGSLQAALEALNRALTLSGKVGVKKDIERLIVAIKNASPAAVDAEKSAETEQPG